MGKGSRSPASGLDEFLMLVPRLLVQTWARMPSAPKPPFI